MIELVIHKTLKILNETAFWLLCGLSLGFFAIFQHSDDTEFLQYCLMFTALAFTKKLSIIYGYVLIKFKNYYCITSEPTRCHLIYCEGKRSQLRAEFYVKNFTNEWIELIDADIKIEKSIPPFYENNKIPPKDTTTIKIIIDFKSTSKLCLIYRILGRIRICFSDSARNKQAIWVKFHEITQD